MRLWQAGLLVRPFARHNSVLRSVRNPTEMLEAKRCVHDVLKLLLHRSSFRPRTRECACVPAKVFHMDCYGRLSWRLKTAQWLCKYLSLLSFFTGVLRIYGILHETSLLATCIYTDSIVYTCALCFVFVLLWPERPLPCNMFACLCVLIRVQNSSV